LGGTAQNASGPQLGSFQPLQLCGPVLPVVSPLLVVVVLLLVEVLLLLLDELVLWGASTTDLPLQAAAKNNNVARQLKELRTRKDELMATSVSRWPSITRVAGRRRLLHDVANAVAGGSSEAGAQGIGVQIDPQ